MNVSRGEVFLANYPQSGASGAKKRPVLVVQADTYNKKLHNVIVAQITSNLRYAADPASLLIEVSTPEGQASGLLHDSVISCVNLVTIHESAILQWIGSLPPATMLLIDECLKAALGMTVGSGSAGLPP